jgi:hypothetical protein
MEVIPASAIANNIRLMDDPSFVGLSQHYNAFEMNDD